MQAIPAVFRTPFNQAVSSQGAERLLGGLLVQRPHRSGCLAVEGIGKESEHIPVLLQLDRQQVDAEPKRGGYAGELEPLRRGQ